MGRGVGVVGGGMMHFSPDDDDDDDASDRRKGRVFSRVGSCIQGSYSTLLTIVSLFVTGKDNLTSQHMTQ